MLNMPWDMLVDVRKEAVCWAWRKVGDRRRLGVYESRLASALDVPCSAPAMWVIRSS